MFGKQGWVDNQTARKLRNGYEFKKKRFNGTGKVSTESIEQLGNNHFTDEDPEKSATRHHASKDTKSQKVKKCAKFLGCFSVVMLPMALTLTIIGLATPFWFKTTTGSIGLFQTCTSSPSKCEDVTSFLASSTSNTSSKWYVVIGLVASGCFLLLASMVLAVGALLSLERRKNKSVACGLIISAMMFFGSVAIVCGIAVMITYYKGQTDYSFEWSFYMTTCGGAVAFLSFCFYFAHVCIEALSA